MPRTALSPRFKGEEVPTTVTYPPHHRPRPVPEQVARLRQLFPELGPAGGVPALALPAQAEAWFALPRWQRLAPTYAGALSRLLGRMKGELGFTTRLSGELESESLRQSRRTKRALEALGRGTTGDILLVPAQLGLRHRGRSVRRAHALFEEREFGLGVFHVGVVLLTHPERLAAREDLGIDCAGDERGGVEVPLMSFVRGELELGSSAVSHPHAHYGSATGFLPRW